MRRRGPSVLERRVSSIDPNQIAICSVVLAELLVGAYRSDQREKNFADIKELQKLFQSLPFDDSAASEFADIGAGLIRRGKKIGHNVLMIAAIARSAALIVVTHNSHEFDRVANLKCEDWQTAP
ncbi:MAG: type II toxin-antitoxin system VapC family toxin [Anaerolineae bacterium]|nr:type II toxin-antitoxin system VapC family toxin [Phycisphaerae bacterium]